MLNVALTGNIAAGKSAVVGLFRQWGATIIDADELARRAASPGSEVLTAIGRRFGKDVLQKDGSLDRPALRAKVMGDEDALAALNAIVHPAVRRRRAELQEEAARRGDILVINDTPLLFEAADPARFDAVVLVDAPIPVRRARLRLMRGLTNDEADRMLASQMPAERKRPLAQFVIDNDGTPEELERKARAVFEDLRRRAAAAALGRPARTLLLARGTAQDEPPAAAALAARYRDAGLDVHTATGTAAVEKAVRAHRPEAIVATPGAAAAARAAWERAGRTPVLAYWQATPDAGAVVLDLRPWNADRVVLTEESPRAAPRDDLFPRDNALA